LNVTQPIVAAVGPARPRSQLAERQVEIIAYDEQALGWQLVEVHQLTNALPAQVHEGLRFHQQDLLGAFHPLGNLGMKSRLKTPNIRPGGERVDHSKTDIMPRAVIAAARIAKADHRLHFGEQAVGSRQYAVGNVLPAAYCLLPTAHYSPSGSSAAGLRVMTSGSAVSPATGAATTTASGSMAFAVTWTTITSGSSIALTPSGSAMSRTWIAWSICNSPTFTRID